MRGAVTAEFFSRSRLARFGVLILLLGLYAGSGFHRLYSIQHQPFYHSEDGTGFFWSENALHFRQTQMISQGEGVPEIDQNIQYPEGINNRKYITIVMEHLAGRLHRLLFSHLPLHVFLVYFTSFFTSLSVLALFLAVRGLSGSPLAALVSTALFCISPASFFRIAIG